MPTTYAPDEEPTPTDKVREAVEQAVVGRSPLRSVILYLAIGLLCLTPAAPLAILPVVLLVATDTTLG
jgi:hypothetical protein